MRSRRTLTRRSTHERQLRRFLAGHWHYSRRRVQSRNTNNAMGRGAFGGALLGAGIGALAGGGGRGAAIGAGAGAFTGVVTGGARAQGAGNQAWWDAYNYCMSTRSHPNWAR
jgi:outer membrane lipoprotein SlyB